MLIWRGWGILAVVLGFGALVAAQSIVDAVAGRGTYSENSGLFGGVALVIGGVATFFLGRWLNDPKRNRVLVDKPRNDLFWIPMEIWGGVLVVGGLVMFVVGMLS